jgi:hypothetical protein
MRGSEDMPFLDMYLNQEDVKTALHIDPAAPVWSACTAEDSPFNYTMQFEASQWLYRVLKVQAKAPMPFPLRLMHYSGDTDGIVPTYGTKLWI